MLNFDITLNRTDLWDYPMEADFTDKLRGIIETHLTNPDFGVEQLAREMNMSYSSLRRRISSATGRSANQIIREIRLVKAFELLQQGEMTIGEIAYRCGFNSPNYFTTCFQDYFKFSPSDLKGEQGDQLVESLRLKEEKGARRRSRQQFLSGLFNRAEWIVIPLSFILVITAGVIFAVSRQDRRPTSIAVLMPGNLSQNPEIEPFCKGLQDQLMLDLGKNTALKVISRVSTGHYQAADMGITEIGRKLRADLVMWSVVSLKDGSIYLTTNLIDTKNDIPLYSNKFERRLTDPFALEAELSNAIIRGIDASLQQFKTIETTEDGSSDAEAVRLFAAGKFLSDAQNDKPETALANYRKAIRKDTLFAGAYLGLANLLNKLYACVATRKDTFLAESLWAIQKAAGIDRNLTGVHRAYGAYFLRTGDFNRSIDECRRELELDPGSQESLYIQAEAWMSLGRWDKAENSLHRALEKSPYQALPNFYLGYIYELKRDFTKARRHYNLAYSLNHTYLPTIYGMAGTDLKSHGDPAGTLVLLDSLTAQPANPENKGELSSLHAFFEPFAGRYAKTIRLPARPGKTTLYPWSRYVRPNCLLKAMAFGYLNETEMERDWYDSTRIYLGNLQQDCLANRNDPRLIAALGMAFAGLGFNGRALEYAAKTEKLLEEKPDALIGPYALEDVACIYTREGRYDKALSLIEKLLSAPGPLTFRLLKIDPRWETLREQPGFKELQSNVLF